jgi:CheY-like chemotaxis protein
MALQGPIIIVEDDYNDAEVITTAIKEIGVPNEIKHIPSAGQAYDYLMTTSDRPFIILSDIRMPVMNGLEFRKKIIDNEFLRRKSIPFVFYTALVSQEMVNEAYDLTVQGFYEKARSYEGVRSQLYAILNYWNQCLHPNRDLVRQ